MLSKGRKPQTEVSTNPLIAAVAGPPDDEGMTAQELASASSQPLKTVQSRLKALLAEDRVVTGFRTDLDARGRRTRIPVYRMKTEARTGA